MLTDAKLVDAFKDIPECQRISHWCGHNLRFRDFLQSPEVSSKIASVVNREKGNKHKLLDRLSELEFAYKLLKLQDYSIVKYESPITHTKRTIDFHLASPHGEFNVEIARINPNPLDKLRGLIIGGLTSRLKSIQSKYIIHINNFYFDWPINAGDSRSSHVLLHHYSAFVENKGILVSAINWLSGMMVGVLQRLTTEYCVDESYSFPLFEFVDSSNACHHISISMNVSFHRSKGDIISETDLQIPVYNCNYTGFEYEKYGNRIIDKIEQFSEGRPNLFIMHSDSDTHDPGHGTQSEFIAGINRSLNRMVIVKTDQKSVDAVKYLSACLLITRWTGFDYSQCVWFNKHAANKISERVLFDVYGTYHPDRCW